MQLSNIIFWSVILIFTLEFVFERILSFLNQQSWSTKLPKKFDGIYNQDKYQEAMDYSKANSKMGLLSSSLSFIVILLALFLGWFSSIDGFVNQWIENPIMRALVFFGILGLASSVMSLPFSVYSTFVIEERFGFNKTDIKTFVLDMLKGALLSIIIGGLVLSIIVFLYLQLGANFWWAAWLVIAVFMLFMTMFYSNLIVPLFNKQTPLEEGVLRTAISAFSEKVGFKLDNIYVIDGSKRSTKANAYFTGLGVKKRIVLYDTLISDHSTEELVAVLAHEIGHYKKKHTRTSLVLGLLQTGLMFYLLSLFIAPGGEIAQSAANAIDAKPSFQIGILVFGILYTPISTILGIFMNMISRKNEYEADAFASKNYSAEKLSNALIKMSVKHLSNLSPHPAFVFVNYSHPPLMARLKAMGLS
ncbi:MAG: M48 family metallopeptidase [Bacteroidales bacterium]|nr:M48 family metallopeptidase [Bacteroidales bacterium]